MYIVLRVKTVPIVHMTDIRWLNVMTNILDYYYDAHSPQARDLYWKQANDSLLGRYGWDAWWVDQCEPDNGNVNDPNYMIKK